MLIQWGEGRQRLWVELTGSTDLGAHWLVVVHGGAWRDEKITQQSAQNIFSNVNRAHFTGLASLDYRLSPSVKHPGHLNDVKKGVEEIVARFRPASLTLVGHSCGAFLCGQVYSAFPDLISSVVCVEGIHNLALLVEEYPSYRGFVSEAFDQDWPAIDWRSVPVKAIVHSKQDELLSLQQSQWLSRVVGVNPYLLDEGKHDEVYETLTSWIHKIL